MPEKRKVCVVTGANRPNGIGFSLVSKLVQRTDTLVFATARDPTRAPELQSLAEENDNLVVLKLEATSETDAQAAAADVEAKAGRLDVLIANAGYFAPGWVLDLSLDSFRKSWETNTLGTIIFFKAFADLLFKADAPVFAPISTAGGSMGLAYPAPLAAYGSSKAALNYITVSLHVAHEQQNLTAFVTHPGLVDTDMGDAAIASVSVTKEQAGPISVDQSTDGLLKVFDGATRASHGGRFFSYDGSQVPW